MCGVYVKVDEYSPGHQMKVAYWRPSGSSRFLSEFLLNEHKSMFHLFSHSFPLFFISSVMAQGSNHSGPLVT